MFLWIVAWPFPWATLPEPWKKNGNNAPISKPCGKNENCGIHVKVLKRFPHYQRNQGAFVREEIEKSVTPSSTSPSSNVTGLDGESGDANTPSSNSENSSTPTPSPTPGAAVEGRGGAALLSNLKNAGFSGEKLRLAWSVGMAESGGDPKAFNGNTRTGDQSYGLFQINMIGAMGPERRRQFGIQSNDELFDPQVNIRAMLKVSSNGTNWKPWSAYKSGAYRRFYDKFQDS